MEPKGTRLDWLEACKKLPDILKESDVAFATSLDEGPGLWHTPLCNVTPGIVEDVQSLVRFIADNAIPFVIQSGKRSMSPSFASTRGLLISLAKLNTIEPAEDAQTVSIGPGTLWEDVYQKLDPLEVTVAGARIIKVGVGGMILGGGLGWFVQQQGYTIDTINYMDVVLPTGEYLTGVSKTNHADLFWALKGTGNNFGIVVNFNLFTKPQKAVYGGFYLWQAENIPAAIAAVADLVNANKDVKLQLNIAFAIFSAVPYMTLMLCYDGETIPDGLLDKVDSVPALQRDVKTRSMHSLVTCVPSPQIPKLKRTFSATPMKDLDPQRVMEAGYAAALEYGGKEADGKAEFATFSYEPLLSCATKFATDSAFSHTEHVIQNGRGLGWFAPQNDEKRLAETREFAAKIQGQFEAGHGHAHPNYALEGTDPECLFGDIAQLFSLQEKYDPSGVMALTSGHKFS